MPRYDIVILGGGIIGCALAEELAGRGQRVVVVERGRIGAEASSAAAGILASQTDVARPGPLFELCQASRARYPRWVAHLARRSGRTLAYQANGLLYLAATARDEQRMDRRARWQRRRGLRVERWSPAEVRRREPAVDGPVRRGFYFSGEAQVDNVALMEALAIAARRAGATLRERVAVRRVLLRGSRVHGVETAHGTLVAPVVVNCLGSWADMGGTFPVRLPVEPVRGQLVMFRGPSRLLRRTIISQGVYAVPRRHGHLLLGSTLEHVGFSKALTASGIGAILRGLFRLSSALRQCTFLEAWAGLRPWTRNARPIIGQTGVAGLYVATGHYRHGILLAPVTARLLADLILQGRAAALTPFTPLRFGRRRRVSRSEAGASSRHHKAKFANT